ncbi:putative conserved oligomeric golgi complex subunit [Trypanosoma grayi]|uniref:putative conserved oligomeric golgi complex subunit n=1 Tax=Trypanosoma grayi TaxID=71804 RepID=UPI0004F450CC|nr:putative conserved oligomeric golgi complex subunit [Trypanosoma grayi]KEG15512.1 putative conserved oligomeric golgi complex subunit [Trypanosoma grayi]
MSSHVETVHDGGHSDNKNYAGDEPAVDLEQLQLIQLCFGEHEFGVAFENDAQQNEDDLEAEQQQQEDEQNDVVIAFDFDPVQFVQEKLDHGVPLGILCRDLETYMTFLNNSILRHVNTDVHDAFVKVSGHLVGVQDELRCVQQPVLATVKKVEDAMARLTQLEERVHAHILSASNTEMERLFDVGFLKLLLLYDLLCERIEALPSSLRSSDDGSQQPLVHTAAMTTNAVNIHHANGSSPSCSSSSRAAAVVAGSAHMREALCDIAITVQQLKALHQTLPRLSQREKEREEATEILRDGTELSHNVFARVYLALYEDYMQDPRETLTHAMRSVMEAYQTAGEVQEFCRMYRKRILRPLLESVLSWRAATQARHSLEDTVKLLVCLRDQLEVNVLPFLPLLREAFEGAVMPIPMIIWPTVCEALVKKMVSLYDVGIPDAFQKRYMAAHELLALMEANCASSEELHMLVQSPDVALWKHKWNTDVYGTIRANELSKRVDGALQAFAATPLEQQVQQREQGSSVECSTTFHTDPFVKLQEALEWLFSPSTYIYTVTPKFIREAAGATQRLARSVLDYADASQANSSMRDWISLVMSACSDFEAFAVYIEGPFRTRLESASGRTFAVSSPVIQLIAQETCRAAAVSLHRAVQMRVAEECAAGMQNIRSVKSAYSHMRKPFPTAPSWYVPNIVEPLQRFAATVESLPSAPARDGMVAAVVEEVANRFRVIAKETLVTAKKTEESWEKLRRRKETTAGGRGTSTDVVVDQAAPAASTTARPTPETATDRDKMTLQLYLDAKAFVEAAETTLQNGVVTQQLPGVVALFRMLRRANWILGEDIPEPPDIDESDV